VYALAASLAPHGVAVNAEAPALIQGGETLPGDEESRRQLAELTPVGRLGSTEEVAEAVLSLIFNSFITAQTVSVDGGMHPR
jgi:3-oxoacyl-[acyl-carrier protein] reductase